MEKLISFMLRIEISFIKILLKIILININNFNNNFIKKLIMQLLIFVRSISI